MGTASEFLGELIAFMTSYLSANFVFGMSILQIFLVPILFGMVISLILGRATTYLNAPSRYRASQHGKDKYKEKMSKKKG